jgi:hypothetical protein
VKREILYRLTLLLLSIAVMTALGETVLRVFFPHRTPFVKDERNMLFRHDMELGWFPVKNSAATYTGFRVVHIRHNSMGFRDREHTDRTRPAVLFLGDSFVWGYDVEQEERFTERLSERMPDREIINMGVSGYGTDQEYLLLQKFFPRFKPDIVFLIFCSDNDMLDNSSNRIAYGEYYKPYFESVGDSLVLRGTPVPESVHFVYRNHPTLSRLYLFRALIRLHRHVITPHRFVSDPTRPLIKAMRRYVEDRDAVFLVGLQQRMPSLETFLDRQNLPWVHLAGAPVYPANGHHWTPEGHALVSDIIYEFLDKEKYRNTR